jgi:CheY-like chemotaxis protein
MINSYTILYIDDDFDDLELISEAFLHYTSDIKVIQAYNGKLGIDLLERMELSNHLPCLIILDINMPVMDGKETLKLLKTTDRFKNIPVIVFSTSKGEKDKQFAEKWGADFIPKPVSYKNLEGLVKEFVERCEFNVEARSSKQ